MKRMYIISLFSVSILSGCSWLKQNPEVSKPVEEFVEEVIEHVIDLDGDGN